MVRFIADGLDRAEPVLAAVPGDRLAWLRAALGDAAADVTMTDITEVGRNPGRILAAQLGFVDRYPDQHVRIITEPVWAGRNAFEYPACMQHEALANIAFAGLDVTGLCPYDASQLDKSVLADVRLTHPQVWQGGARKHSPDYALDAALDQCNQPLTTNPAAVTYTVGDPADWPAPAAAATGMADCSGCPRTDSATSCWSPPSWPATASTMAAARADWRSGTRPDTWSARRGIPVNGQIRSRDAGRPPRREPGRMDFSSSTPSRICCAPTPHRRALRSTPTCGSTIPLKMRPSNLVAVVIKSKSILAAIAAVAAIALVTGGCTTDTATTLKPVAAPDFAAALRGRVSTDAMMAHLTKLQEIAKANGNTRAVGTPGYDASVDYVVDRLRDKGFDVQTMQFDAHVFHSEPGSLTVGDKTFEARALEYSLGHPAGRGDRSAGRRPGRRRSRL